MMMLTHIRGKGLTLFKCLFLCTLLLFPIKKCFLNDALCFFSGGGYSGNQENRYVGFGNTVTPEKKEEDFINNAMSSIYSVGHDIHILAELYLMLHFSFPVTSFSFGRVGAVSLLELASLRLLLKIM